MGENTSVGRGSGNGIGRRIDNVQSVDDCRAECWKNAACRFFIWNGPEAPRQKFNCFLKRNSLTREVIIKTSEGYLAQLLVLKTKTMHLKTGRMIVSSKTPP